MLAQLTVSGPKEYQHLIKIPVEAEGLEGSLA